MLVWQLAEKAHRDHVRNVPCVYVFVEDCSVGWHLVLPVGSDSWAFCRKTPIRDNWTTRGNP